MACGYQSPKWMGKCPNCGAWNQMEEIVEKAANPKHGVKTKELAGKVQKLNSIKHENNAESVNRFSRIQPCIRWRYCERIVSTYCGDPGIGKSTLLLQICASLSQKKKVLYITGEESLSQTKLRAERLDEDSSELQVLAETDLEVIYQTVKEEQPDLLVVDSIQTYIILKSALRQVLFHKFVKVHKV